MNFFEETMKNIPMLNNMNLHIVDYSKNKLVVRMPFAGNQNHVGIVYAGAIFSLAEFPFGALSVYRFGSDEIVPVVGEVAVRYLAPAKSDLTVSIEVSDQEWEEIEQETKSNGKFKVVREVDVKDGTGKIVAALKATYFMLHVKH